MGGGFGKVFRIGKLPFNGNVSAFANVVRPNAGPDLRTTSDDTWGLGDINMSLFLSPAKSEGLIWGLGLVFLFPTGTDEVLSTRKWAAGPSGVGLFMHGPWVVGLLANNLWSYAGNNDRKDVSQFLAQYFVNYNLPDA